MLRDVRLAFSYAMIFDSHLLLVVLLRARVCLICGQSIRGAFFLWSLLLFFSLRISGTLSSSNILLLHDNVTILILVIFHDSLLASFPTTNMSGFAIAQRGRLHRFRVVRSAFDFLRDVTP